jgi:phosphatidylserine decarboxylase
VDIKYINRKKNNQLENETVYGEKWVRWCYESGTGKKLQKLIGLPVISRMYGHLQDGIASQGKVLPFIEKFNINMDEFVLENNEAGGVPYSSFNNFFIRKFKEGRRNFPEENHKMGACAEARYFAWDKITPELKVPVKGVDLLPEEIIDHPEYSNMFQEGPLMIARLCPVDYHRFHYPDDGELVDRYKRGSELQSVNPLALKYKSDIFLKNERMVSILKTKNFGHLAYVEVGAVMVGKIVQSAKGKNFQRGDEKGYFLFGGSTVIVIGEKGKWSPSEDILNNTAHNLETYITLGDEVAKS